jgi:DNA-binding transcriptional LysR family regulator
MRSPAIPSVDQLLVLLTVAEAGSFTAAAKRLGRATSAVSYAIDTLEAQLGLSLFDRGTTRKPKLTQQGEAVVSEARAVAHSIETLRARVRGFLDALEPEVSLAVDSMLPSDRLTKLLRDFHAQFPTVPVRLLVETLGGVERVVRNGDAGIGVGSLMHMEMTGFRRIALEVYGSFPSLRPLIRWPMRAKRIHRRHSISSSLFFRSNQPAQAGTSASSVSIPGASAIKPSGTSFFSLDWDGALCRSRQFVPISNPASSCG